MTIIDRPLARGNRPDMTKANIKTENDFSDCFNEIQITSDYCSLHDLDLNADHFTEMHDFNDINISQLLTKSEPSDSMSAFPDSRNTSRVIGETNQVLSGSSYWDFLSKPQGYSVPDRPAKFSPVHYATCYPATTVHGAHRQPESSNWSSPNPASPESLLPAFSNFNCNSGMEQNHYGAVCKDSDPYVFPVSMGVDHSVPEPPAYSYQTLSPPSHDLHGSPSSWNQLPPLQHNPGPNYTRPSNFSSPAGSLSELHAASTAPSLQIPLPMSTAQPSTAMPQPSYLSHSFPGASMSHRTSRNPSGTALGNNACPMPYTTQQASCQSSPLSQASPEAACHSWSDLPNMSYQSYVANGASSVTSDLDLDNLYMSEERTSPLGESLPGDVSPLDEALSRGARRVPRPAVRRIRSRSGSHSPKSMELWQFLWVLLVEQNGGGAVVWLDRPRGVFKVINQVKLCELWSEAKRRNPERTKVTRYSNLTRTLRYYYQRGLMKKGERDHVYQFIAGKIDQWVQTRARSATH